MTEVICDNKRLMYSNRICCINNESVSFKIDLTSETEINIEFRFHCDETSETKTSLQSPEDGKVVINLTNYTHSLGTGVTAPVAIGELDGKKLFIIFYVYRLNKAALPILDMSLYMEV